MIAGAGVGVQCGWKQEQEIVFDAALMLFAPCAVRRWTLEQIVDTYAIARSECIGCLTRLESGASSSSCRVTGSAHR